MTLVLVEAVVKPESLETFQELLAKHFPETRKFDGCRGIEAFLGEDGTTVVFVEHWDSREHYDQYFAWREETGVIAELVSHLSQPPNIRSFEPIEA